MSEQAKLAIIIATVMVFSVIMLVFLQQPLFDPPPLEFEEDFSLTPRGEE